MAAPLLLAAVIVEFSAVVSAIIEHPSMNDVMDVVSPYASRRVEGRAKLAQETLRQGASGFAMRKTCPRVQIATYPTNPESGSETRSVSRIEARQHNNHQIRKKGKQRKTQNIAPQMEPSRTSIHFLRFHASTHLLSIRLYRRRVTRSESWQHIFGVFCPSSSHSRPRPPSPDAPVALTYACCIPA